MCNSGTISIFIAIAVPYCHLHARHCYYYHNVVIIAIIVNFAITIFIAQIPSSERKISIILVSIQRVKNIEYIRISIRSEIVTSTIRISCLHSYRTLFVASVISCL